MIEFVLVVGLVGAWAAVLVPPLFRSRLLRGSGDTIGSFEHRMAVLRAVPRRMSGRGLSPAFASADGVVTDLAAHRQAMRDEVPPEVRSRRLARRRRRHLLYALLAAAGFTLLLAAVGGGAFITLHIVADSALVSYVALLIRAQKLAAEREIKVAFLPHGGVGVEPTVLLRDLARSGS